MNDEIPVKLPEMARRLNASPEKVYRMAQRGEIPAFKLGREWRFFPSKVIASLEEVSACTSESGSPGQRRYAALYRRSSHRRCGPGR